MKLLPYPLSATRISIDFMPFGFWLKPSFIWRRDLTEQAKENGEPIWWARWAWFQIIYQRWV